MNLDQIDKPRPKKKAKRDPEVFRASTQRYLERKKASDQFEPVPFVEEQREILHGPRRGEIFIVLTRQHSNEAV
jgi:hypothetical protein